MSYILLMLSFFSMSTLSLASEKVNEMYIKSRTGQYTKIQYFKQGCVGENNPFCVGDNVAATLPVFRIQKEISREIPTEFGSTRGTIVGVIKESHTTEKKRVLIREHSLLDWDQIGLRTGGYVVKHVSHLWNGNKNACAVENTYCTNDKVIWINDKSCFGNFCLSRIVGVDPDKNEIAVKHKDGYYSVGLTSDYATTSGCTSNNRCVGDLVYTPNGHIYYTVIGVILLNDKIIVKEKAFSLPPNMEIFDDTQVLQSYL